jgi:phage shock protein PspC (stress-responsive transcriptional regulator)
MTVPEWTEAIADRTLCGYFYVFFIIFSVWAGLSLVAGAWIFMASKMSPGLLVSHIFSILLSFGISATSALFLYLICERALNPEEHADHAHKAKKASGPMMM